MSATFNDFFPAVNEPWGEESEPDDIRIIDTAGNDITTEVDTEYGTGDR